jgi:hypothetical protein
MPRGGQSAPAVADVMGESGPASDRRERRVMAGKSAVPKRQASRRVVVIQLAPSQILGRIMAAPTVPTVRDRNVGVRGLRDCKSPELLASIASRLMTFSGAKDGG